MTMNKITPKNNAVIVTSADILRAASDTGHGNPDIQHNWQERAENGGLVMFAFRNGDQYIASVNLLLDGADEQLVKDEIGANIPILNALGTNEEFRGRGYGTELINVCEDYVKSHLELPQTIALGVELDNKLARLIYEKCGYEYKTVNGQESYESSWPEINENGEKVMYSTRCLLMTKNL